VDPSDRDRSDLGNGAPHGGTDEPRHDFGRSGEDDRWLRSVVANSSDIVTIVDSDGTLRYASTAFERVLGYDPDKEIGTMNVLESVHPDDLPHVLEETEKALSEGGVVTNKTEYRFRHKDGSWRWMESVGTYLLDDPAVGGVVVTSRDVTERKESEERLRRAEERYRTLVERVPAVVYVQEIGSPDSPMYMSPRIEALTGYTPEECKDPEMWWRMVHPEDRGRMQPEDERMGEPGEAFASEYRVLHREGRTVWVRNESVLVEDEESGSRHWQGFMLDITERRLVEAALRESEQRFRRSFDNATIGMALVGTDGCWLQVNRSLCDMLGYSEEELLGKTFQDITHPDDLDVDLDNLGRMLAGETRTYQTEKRYFHREGHVVWILLSVSMVHDEEGELLYFVSQIQDISERKGAEQKIREAEQRYRTLVEQIPAVTYIDPVDDPHTSLYTSPQIEQMLGYTPQEWQSEKLWPKRLHPDDRERILVADERFEAGGEESFSEEYRLLAKDGSVVWVREEAVLVRDEAGEPLYWQGVFYDLTERKVLEERLEHRALHDPLTDLPNRRLFMDRLGQALRRTRRREKGRVAVLFMDLDGFKVVNDSLGHETGDKLLVAVSERLKRCLRPEDTFARFGGDEFVVLLEDVEGPQEAVRVAERIIDELKDRFVLDGRELYARASIGIALGEDRTKDPDDLLRNADTAMYRAKDEGMGYSVFDTVMYEKALDTLEAENDLRRAVEQEEFVLHYQPIVRLQSVEVVAVEALVRWEHPERGLLDPDEFVPMAEDSGHVIPMGKQVLREACLRAKEWQEAHPRTPPLVMSVNLSARQLSRPDLAETVEGILKETGLEGSCLTLDVTETIYVRTLAGNTETLDRLRDLGARISIDDFGVGYSSLAYLKRLPADALKIDKSFVKGLGEDVEDTAIVHMIIELAHTLGLEVIAEGVESEGQATLLREMGCDFAQGYHFEEPLPPEEIPALLSSATLT
jgi:diguanylate cyclase (GGDEF)-like protein/PAS domain S-box-containing protein